MANIDRELAILNNDYIAEVEAGAKIFEEYQNAKNVAAQRGIDEAEVQGEINAKYGIGYEEAQKYARIQKTQLTPAFKEGAKEGEKFATGIGTAMGIYSSKATGMLQGLLKFIKLSKSEDGLGGIAKGMKKIINPTNMAAATIGMIVAETIKLAFAVDKASAAFASATGAGRMYTEGINAVASANRRFGISAEDSGKAFQTLFSGFRGFNNESPQTQKYMAESIAGLEKLGVSAQESSDIINFMNINLGKSGIESAKLTKELALSGKAIGMTSKQMVAGFKESLKSLSVYGKGAVKVFSNMAAQAKAAGVEVSALLGLADKFDTFGGAAETAGKLNAILGSQLSATELLTMKEDERIETLISSIQAQGDAFNQLDRFTQKSIAAAAGISDINEAQKIFSMSVGDYKNFSAAAKASAKTQEEFNQRMTDAMDVMKKIQVLAASFAIAMGPAVEVFGSFIEKLTWILTAGDGIIAKLVGFVAGFKLLVVVGKTLLGPTTALGSTALPLMGKGVESLGVSMTKAGPQIQKGGAQLTQFSVGVWSTLTPVILLVGAVALLTAAIGYVVSQLASLIETAINAPQAFAAVAIGINDIAKALAFAANPASLIGLTAVSALLGGMAAVFSVGAEVDFDSMDDALNTMANNSATIKPILGDLALITAGKTTQNVNDNSVATSISAVTADIKNLFKFDLTIPGSELAKAIDDRADRRIEIMAQT